MRGSSQFSNDLLKALCPPINVQSGAFGQNSLCFGFFRWTLLGVQRSTCPGQAASGTTAQHRKKTIMATRILLCDLNFQFHASAEIDFHFQMSLN